MKPGRGTGQTRKSVGVREGEARETLVGSGVQ